MVTRNQSFTYLMTIPLSMSYYKKDYLVYAIACFTVLYLKDYSLLPMYGLAIGFGSLYQEVKQKEDDFLLLYDQERQHRYKLQRTQNELLLANENIVSITELNERNRIARSIHDNLGHKLVRVNMILQAAQAVKDKNPVKSDDLTHRAINELTESVNLLRDTVHDLKPNKDVGLKSFENIIKNYTFCKVVYETSGNLNQIKSGHLAVLSQSLKEALTNSSRYSKATLINVQLDVTVKYVRLCVGDNGHGSTSFNEGLGITGMRDRISNLGGTLTINREKGFEIIMFLPI